MPNVWCIVFACPMKYFRWPYRGDGYGRASRDNETCPAQTPKWKTVLSKAQAESHTASTHTVRSRVCVVCAPPMRCMCAVTASDSRMSDGLRLQTFFNYIHTVSIEFCRKVRATIRFPITLHNSHGSRPRNSLRNRIIFNPAKITVRPLSVRRST